MPGGAVDVRACGESCRDEGSRPTQPVAAATGWASRVEWAEMDTGELEFVQGAETLHFDELGRPSPNHPRPARRVLMKRRLGLVRQVCGYS